MPVAFTKYIQVNIHDIVFPASV